MGRPRRRVVAIGDAIVDLVTPPLASLHAGDSQREISGLSILPGGNATNFALQMGTLGMPTSLVACVGSDAFADVLSKAYKSARLDARLRTDPTRATGSTVALTWSNGGRALVTALGANAGLRERDVPGHLLEAADHVHRAGFWWATGLLGAPTARILRRAHRAKAGTSLDVSTDPRGWSLKRVEAVRSCLPHVDTFFGNETEVCAVAGARSPLDAAQRLLDSGADEVVIHRGSEGATWVHDGKVVRSPAFRVPVDNPTGCGDVFNAGYMFAKLSGASVSEGLGFGNACAGLHLSDRDHPYPNLAELRRFFRKHA